MSETIKFTDPNHHCDAAKCDTLPAHDFDEDMDEDEEQHCSACPTQSYDIVLPAKYEVCPTCRGNGKHVNPAIDGNGLTQEDFDEQGPDFREDYMSGVYDVTCQECKGLRVVLVPDREQLTAEQLEAYEKHEDDEYLYHQERRMEMSMEQRYGY